MTETLPRHRPRLSGGPRADTMDAGAGSRIYRARAEQREDQTMTIYTRGKYAHPGLCIDNGPHVFTAVIAQEQDGSGKRRIEPVALSELLDRICLALNQEEVREAAPHSPWPVGTRVRLIQEFENFDVGYVPAGEFGRVVEVLEPDERASQDDVMGKVKLEKHHDCLDEWENCIIVMADAEYGITWASFTPADDQDGDG